MLRVSVVIPTYNHARFLAQAIESALGQTLRPFEVIVVDDGSTDDSARILSRYADRIQVIRQTNQGVATARNAGAAVASGDLLAFLDADDVWLPGKLEKQAQRFQADPELGLVHCGFEEIDEKGRRLRSHLNGLEGWVADEMLLFRRPVILGGGSAVALPRTVFHEVGGFDPRLSTSADWDLYHHVARLRRVGFVQEVLLQYRYHASNMSSNVKAMEHDMLLAYAKAFEGTGTNRRALRRRCYGNLHAVIAGSYFSAGDFGAFLHHAVRSLIFSPGNIPRFASFPVRRWRYRKTGAPSQPGSGSSIGDSEKIA